MCATRANPPTLGLPLSWATSWWLRGSIEFIITNMLINSINLSQIITPLQYWACIFHIIYFMMLHFTLEDKTLYSSYTVRVMQFSSNTNGLTLSISIFSETT